MSKEANKKWDYLYDAVMLPYKKGTFDIDWDAYRKMVRYHLKPEFVEAGAAIICNPEAGEIFYLTEEEKLKVLEVTLEEVNGKFPVFCGVCALRTEDYAKSAEAAKKAGADGLFFCPPMGSGDITYAWDPFHYPEYWTDILHAIVKKADLPIIMHPTSGVSKFGVGLPVEPSLAICKEIPNIVGWKMTYSYLGWTLIAKAFRTKLDRHVAILGAPSDIWHTALVNGEFDGCVNGLMTASMEQHTSLVTKFRSGDYQGFLDLLHGGFLDFARYVYDDYSRLHIRYKIATWMRGFMPEPFMRPPQPVAMKSEVKELHRLMKKMGADIIDEAEIKRVSDKLPR
jgi:dihydrodipicolinate synthase/N-acetylneuraminate lyase